MNLANMMDVGYPNTMGRLDKMKSYLLLMVADAEMKGVSNEVDEAVTQRFSVKGCYFKRSIKGMKRNFQILSEREIQKITSGPEFT